MAEQLQLLGYANHKNIQKNINLYYTYFCASLIAAGSAIPVGSPVVAPGQGTSAAAALVQMQSPDESFHGGKFIK